MDSPLHTAPLGLLELLRIKTLGRAPTEFGGVLVPMIESAEFYANKLVSGAAPSVGAIGGAGLQELQQNTATIRLHAIQARLTVGAAAATNVSLSCVVFDPRLNGCCVGSIFLPATAVAQVIDFGIVLPKPWVLPAGWQFGARCTGTAAGADHTLTMSSVIDDLVNV